MLFSKEVIINIVCVLVGGLGIGYLLYGIIKSNARKAIGVAIFLLLVSGGVFMWNNYDYFFAQEITIPYPISDMDYFAEENFEGIDAVTNYVRNPDDSITITLSPSKYREFKRMLTDEIDKGIEAIKYSKGIGISDIEYNGSYNEFTVKYFKRDFKEYYQPVTIALFSFGHMYNAFILQDEDNDIYVRFENDNGEITKEYHSLQKEDEK